MGHKGMVSGYKIFTYITRLMSDQQDPRVLGRHKSPKLSSGADKSHLFKTRARQLQGGNHLGISRNE